MRGEKFGKLLGHGELRYIILHLLKDQPRHGYEIIKAIEELSSRIYSPSPGSIYPTLTYLEESGLAASISEKNKKLYSISQEGIDLLKKDKELVQSLIFRFKKMGLKMSQLSDWVGREEIAEVANENRPSIRRSMHGLKSELFSFTDAGKDVKKKIVEIIDRAAEDIKKLKE